MHRFLFAGLAALSLAVAPSIAEALPAAGGAEPLRKAASAPVAQPVGHSGPTVGLSFHWVFPYDEPRHYRYGRHRHWRHKHHPHYWGHPGWGPPPWKHGRHFRRHHHKRHHDGHRRGHRWHD